MEIIDFLKKNKEQARGIFTKGEIEIIEKQINGIRLTQSEKNRLSRNIRRKLNFISELLKFENEFELKQGTRIKKLIENVKERILENKHYSKIKRITVFGSSVKGQRTFRSDVDMAVEFDKIDKEEAIKFRLEIMRGLDEDLDLQVYNTLPDKIKNEIDKEGKVIYERKNTRENRRY
ncbi:MAG: nucleotidyltransferase domain-containing protein [Nanoarchaeota archaeon]